jgi:nitrous oxidase accessory protein
MRLFDSFFALFVFAALAPCATASALQSAIDRAPEGSVIELSAGVYEGPIVISKSITLEGTAKGAVIRGNGKGSVVSISASFVTLKNLTLEHSGDHYQTIDSCVTVKKADNVTLMDNTMRDCLFGIDFEQTNRSTIEHNHISSKNLPLGLRGDGIRLWYSHANTIRSNVTDKVRDNVFWYSSANQIEGNQGSHSRYSLHFMYADRNTISGNVFRNNSVGIFLMYSQGSVVENNKLFSSSGSAGIGIGMKDVSDCLVQDNVIMYNARGFYLDESPYQPGTVNRFTGNRLLYNTVAIQLHATTLESDFENNVFKGNMTDVDNDTPESRLDLNRWFENSWDTYEGFDRDKDGFGDTPQEIYSYADKLWRYRPSVKFFYASPVMSLLNFLTKLMPFSEPEKILSDPKPLMKADASHD